MKRMLIPLLIVGILLALVFTGKTYQGEPAVFDTLSALMTSGMVEVEGYHLEGWAVVRDTAGEPASIWGKRKLGEKLGLENAEKRIVRTPRGDCFQVVHTNHGLNVQASVQKIEGAERQDCYILIKCILPADLQNSIAWEKRIRDTLFTLGREHGIYLTVCGKTNSPMDEGAQLAFGRAVFRGLGADVSGTLRTSKYLSFTGYTPLLPDAALAGGKNINLNLSMVCKEHETQILLGSPLISCEY
ncbi:MAG TPA: hypothetical protein GXX59_01325 [Syntrophomonadaceae bacterium]|nr:hypothetical protein [Syntrophomonadaceae bacterium]